MKRFVYCAALTLLLISCGKEDNNPHQQIELGAPVVTAEATEVTVNSALLYGYVKTDYLLIGGENGFIVSTSPTPSLDNGQKLLSSEVDINGKYFVQVSGLTSSTTYYYKAFLNTGATNLFGEVKSFKTKDFALEAIDLGLSVKWANANLGATAPEGYGDYYAWGETDPKSDYCWDTYKFGDEKLIKYTSSATRVLDAEDDAAHVKLGGNWRIPTYREIDEIVSTRNNTSYVWEWKSLNGHDGWLVTYLVNNNTIFLPAAGCRNGTSLDSVGVFGGYWSSSLDTDALPYNAWYMYFYYNDVDRNYYFRDVGFSIRPVSD